MEFNSDEFKQVTQLLKHSNQSFYLTGKAGTGKSSYLKHIVNQNFKNIVVVAPTGIAAINAGGVTIHSLFGFPLRPLAPEDEEIKYFPPKTERGKTLREMETLIIDEISMVRADVIDAIDFSLRKNTGNKTIPFGGKQLVFIGDIFQLEPVVSGRKEKRIIRNFYKSPYFFEANVFNQLNLTVIELKTVFRQNDPSFLKFLEKVRTKSLTAKEINDFNNEIKQNEALLQDKFAITLCTKNNKTDNINRQKLAELKGESAFYEAEIEDKFEKSKYPTKETLELKEGAQVICIKNDPEGRWVNGTIAKIHSLEDGDIKIILDNGNIHKLEKTKWENLNYNYDPLKQKISQQVEGTFVQYPIKLAWAITIHKSQGLTFDKLIIDFDQGTFASGQAYVALSRVKTLNGLYLKRPLELKDIYVSDDIIQFRTNNYDFEEKKEYEIEALFNEAFEKINSYHIHNSNKNFLSLLENDFKINRCFDYQTLDSNDNIEAIKKFSEILEVKPSHALSYFMRGIAKSKIRPHDEATKDFFKAIEIRPEYTADAYFYIGLFISNGHTRINSAIKYLTKAIRFDPEYAKAYYYRGRWELILEDKNRAIKNFSKAITLEPEYVNALYYRGKVKKEFERFIDAIEDFSKAIEVSDGNEHITHSRDVYIFYDRAIIKKELENYRGAIEDFSFAIGGKFGRTNPEWYFERGKAKNNLEDYEGAIKDFSSAIDLNPNDAHYYYSRAIAKEDLGDYKGAIKDYSNAIELAPKDASYYYFRGCAKEDLGDIKGAIKDYSNAIELAPKDASYYYFRGCAKEHLGDIKGAIKDYSNAIELASKDAAYYYFRGCAKKDLGDIKGAIKDYSNAIDLKPDKATFYYARAFSKKAIGDEGNAIKDLIKYQKLRN